MISRPVHHGALVNRSARARPRFWPRPFSTSSSCGSVCASEKFIPAKYTQQVLEKSDFRKFDDSLRMVLDCTPQLAAEIESYLKDAAERGVIRYGPHSQDHAMRPCFPPSPTNPTHVHFIDGAQGGYALAAAALKQRRRRD